MNSGRSLLLVAAHPDDDAYGMAGTVALHADEPGFRFVLVHATDGAKMTVLHAAAWGNDTETIRLIVNAGADAIQVGTASFADPRACAKVLADLRRTA